MTITLLAGIFSLNGCTVLSIGTTIGSAILLENDPNERVPPHPGEAETVLPS